MRQEIKLWSLPVMGRAAVMAFQKLDPRVQIRNPVMFMVWIGSLFISVVFIVNLFRSRQRVAALFNPPFSAEQVAALDRGELPPGPL